MPPFQEIIDCRAVLRAESVSGGCISRAWRVEIEGLDGKPYSYFAKQNGLEFLENFQCEANGLESLHRWIPDSIPTPATVREFRQHAYLILPWIESSNSRADHHRLGETLATLHRDSRTTDDKHGWSSSNFLGSSRQPNEPRGDWAEFVARQRIEAQLKMAVDQGLMRGSTRGRLERIISRMPVLLDGRDRYVSLLHGDLWSGNYLFDQNGCPYLIDPAVYRGCPEAEFGMIELYGNCRPEFYEAYLQEHPLPDGWQRRVCVYVLYHLLNHLNLFGSGYLQQCQTIADRILSE